MGGGIRMVHTGTLSVPAGFYTYQLAIHVNRIYDKAHKYNIIILWLGKTNKAEFFFPGNTGLNEIKTKGNGLKYDINMDKRCIFSVSRSSHSLSLPRWDGSRPNSYDITCGSPCEEGLAGWSTATAQHPTPC